MHAFAQFHQFFKPYRGSYHWCSLDVATHGLGLPERGLHGALADAQRTAALIRHVAAQQPRTWTAQDVPSDWV